VRPAGAASHLDLFEQPAAGARGSGSVGFSVGAAHAFIRDLADRLTRRIQAGMRGCDSPRSGGSRIPIDNNNGSAMTLDSRPNCRLPFGVAAGLGWLSPKIVGAKR
jgi:hypothetical protein